MNRTTHNAVLHFMSDTNERIRITIPRARLNKTEADARAVMQAMIDGNAITTKAGRPRHITSMEVVTTQRTGIL